MHFASERDPFFLSVSQKVLRSRYRHGHSSPSEDPELSLLNHRPLFQASGFRAEVTLIKALSESWGSKVSSEYVPPHPGNPDKHTNVTLLIPPSIHLLKGSLLWGL